MNELLKLLRIHPERLQEINNFLLKPENPLIDGLLNVVEEYGGIDEINRKARDANNLDDQISRLQSKNATYVNNLEWLIEKRDEKAFISIDDYRKKILSKRADFIEFDDSSPVTLEISACNFFPWLIEEAKTAIETQSLMPARYIRVRSMKEQVEDGDIIAFNAAMQIIGASYVQTLDNKGTKPGPKGQPVNIHLGGPETITGYFGGVGVPNEYALRWIDEFLYYYTEYGVKEVLNINPGTVILGYLLYKMGVDINFKISVFMGNDNPYSCLWTLMTAALFSRDDGSTPLIGFNLSNSVNNRTLLEAAYTRDFFGFQDEVRIEHHILETWRSIVRQPYDRLEELLEIAGQIINISAKHEGGVPEIEKKREYPSDILDYFKPKHELEKQNLLPKLLINYLDKHEAVNRTAEELTKKELTFIAARNLHKQL